MSQSVVPSWNLKHKMRQDLNQAEERNRFSHVDLNSNLLHQSFSQNVPMSNYEVTELTWENGQLAMHELGGMFPPPPPQTSNSSSPPKPTWRGVSRANDTLESIVHQATYATKQGANPNPNPMPPAQNKKKASSFVGSSTGKWAENSGPIRKPNPPPPPPPPGLAKKRAHSESEHSRLPNDRDSACASGNAGFCRDINNNDTTMMSWASYESDPRSCTRTKLTTDEDSGCHEGSENQEEDRDGEAKGETGRCYTARKGRAAAVHNQSERRRRDRINQKMKALQKLVPNASKTDKASMLDEVIEYLKQLQAQVQMMNNARFMPQIMMPSALGMQQHLQQMSLLARMGLGAGLGMGLGTTNIGQTQMTPQTIQQLMHPTQVAAATSAFVPPGAFVVPQMMPQTQQQNPDPGASSSASLQDQYAALLAQSMNMDLYNTMAALQRQQQQQQQQIPAPPISNQLHSNHVHGG